MLTDIFETRYANRRLWNSYGESERRFLVQAAKIITKQLFPAWTHDRKPHEANKKTLQSILDKVAMEVGIKEFHPKYYQVVSKWNGNDITTVNEWSLDHVYESVLTCPLGEGKDPDSWIKRCLSIVELSFRQRELEVGWQTATFGERVTLAKFGNAPMPKGFEEALQSPKRMLADAMMANIEELNHRFVQAGFPLSYHNGFIQIKTDQLISKTIEQPFWLLVSGPEWKAVDTDMKYALDLRDTGGRDPAFYAARALESVIKIISSQSGRGTGKEKGAANYIDNLVRNEGGRFIEIWEMENLKGFFSKIRNPLGHGPGEDEIVNLSDTQTDWAIEYCMCWIKSLIKRIPISK